MRDAKNSFRHESLQDRRSIQDILAALSEGLAAGCIELGDEEGDMVLEPEGLLNLKLTATQEDAQNRINLRITWQSKSRQPKKKSTLKIKAGAPRSG